MKKRLFFNYVLGLVGLILGGSALLTYGLSPRQYSYTDTVLIFGMMATPMWTIYCVFDWYWWKKSKP
jgi:ABC-type transporter lipoprotein component MlaA